MIMLGRFDVMLVINVVTNVTSRSVLKCTAPPDVVTFCSKSAGLHRYIVLLICSDAIFIILLHHH